MIGIFKIVRMYFQNPMPQIFGMIFCATAKQKWRRQIRHEQLSHVVDSLNLFVVAGWAFDALIQHASVRLASLKHLHM